VFDRDIFFNSVRPSLFAGTLTQQQVDGMDAILTAWELAPLSDDLRHLAYPLATTIHETASTMWPIEEYQKGAGQPYGKKDPETGQTYYGRGFVQLTWRDNYAKADYKLGFNGFDSLEWHAENALKLDVASAVMFIGMAEGWFRTTDGTPNTLAKYFSDSSNDAYKARDIINGDMSKIPSWSGGVSIGNLIKGYHLKFLDALNASFVQPPIPEPKPEPFPGPIPIVTIAITTPPGANVALDVYWNGESMFVARKEQS
jgi:putative chitinase